MNGASIEVRDDLRPARFDVSLFPPWRVDVFDRLSVGKVVLADGTEFASRPFRSVTRSAPAVALIALGAFGLIHTAARFGRSEREDPDRSRERTRVGDRRIVLALFFAASLLLRPAARHFEPAIAAGLIAPEPRLAFHVAILIGYGLALGIYVAIPRIDRFANRRWSSRPRARAVFLLSAYFLCAPVVVAVFLALKTFFILDTSPAAPASSSDSAVRVIFYGGSTTRGHPSPGTSTPRFFRTLLSEPVGRSVEVWNRGADAATIAHIRRNLSRDLAQFCATHVVINSVVNNSGYDEDELEKMFEDAVSLAQRAGAHVLLVHEPSLEMLDPSLVAHARAPVDAVIESVARRHGVATLDPRAEFAERRDEFLFLDDSHLTSHGKLVFARLFVGRIAEEASSHPDSLPPRGISSVMGGF